MHGHDKYWSSSYSQAATALSEGRYSDARAMFDILLGYIESRFGATDLRAAACHQGLAESYCGIGQCVHAEPHYKRGLAILERHLGAVHPFSLKASTALGIFYRNAKQTAKAEIQLAKALHGWSQLDTMPALDVCETLDNLAGLYCDQGREQEAQPLIRQAIIIRQRNLSKDRSEAIKGLIEYAEQQAKLKRFQEAELLMKEALEMTESFYGRNDIQVAHLLKKMSQILISDSRPADAIPYMERALCIKSLVYGDQDERVVAALRNLGDLYVWVGRGPQAAACYEDALETSKKLHGEDSLEAASDLHKLAFIYRNIETHDKAEARAQVSLRIREDKLGKNHPNVISILLDLQEIYVALSRQQDADVIETRVRQTLDASKLTGCMAA